MKKYYLVEFIIEGEWLVQARSEEAAKQLVETNLTSESTSKVFISCESEATHVLNVDEKDQ